MRKIRGNTVGTTMAPNKIGKKIMLTVEIDSEKNIASHNAEQIYEHVKGGGTAVLLQNRIYFPLLQSMLGRAEFGVYNQDEEYAICYIVYADGYVDFSSKDIVDRTILDDNTVLYSKPQNLTPEKKAQARANIGAAAVDCVDEKYFDIDQDGLVSLKLEYRGLGKSGFDYSISDSKEVGTPGSKISELPERLVIPQTIDGETVTGFQVGALAENHRIKEVVFPSTVTSLPSGLLYGSINLKKVENTEQITSVGGSVFMRTGIEEIRFPNLATTGTSVFRECSHLRLVDIGQKIKTIGSQYFNRCERLSTVLGGDEVEEIGKLAFSHTRMLKSLPFISKVTTVGDGAFFGSRCNLEALDATAYANATNATYKQYNTMTGDKYYWEGVTYTPCKNELNSLFDQNDTRWASHTINGTSLNYGDHSCALIVLAEMYSAFTGEKFDSPEQFVAFLDVIYPEWVEHDFRDDVKWTSLAKGLWAKIGCTDPDKAITNVIPDKKDALTADALATIYAALADGALVFRGIGGDADNIDAGHAVLCYGVNSDGELLIADSASASRTIGSYGSFKFASPIYTHGSEKCDVVIVRKPKEG